MRMVAKAKGVVECPTCRTKHEFDMWIDEDGRIRLVIHGRDDVEAKTRKTRYKLTLVGLGRGDESNGAV